MSSGRRKQSLTLSSLVRARGFFQHLRINNNSQVIGKTNEVISSNGPPSLPFIYCGGLYTELSVFDPTIDPVAINNYGQIVGYITPLVGRAGWRVL